MDIATTVRRMAGGSGDDTGVVEIWLLEDHGGTFGALLDVQFLKLVLDLVWLQILEGLDLASEVNSGSLGLLLL